MADPRDEELKRAFAEIPDNIPDEDMPPEIPLPDVQEQVESGPDDELPDGVEEVEVGGQKMTVEEVGSGFGPGPVSGGGDTQRTNELLEQMLMAMQRMPAEIAEELKGG